MTATSQTPATALAFRPAPGVTWALEATGIRILDLGRGRSRFLAYPEAAVWDLLARRSAPEHVVRVWALLAPSPAPRGPEDLRTLLRRWREEGLLEGEGRDG